MAIGRLIPAGTGLMSYKNTEFSVRGLDDSSDKEDMMVGTEEGRRCHSELDITGEIKY